MYQECIARSINHLVWIVVQLILDRVLNGVDFSVTHNISEDIGNMGKQSVVDISHGLSRPAKSHAEARIICLESLDVGTDLEGGRERAQDRNVMTVLWDVTILDFQSLNIVQTNSSYLKVLEGNT